MNELTVVHFDPSIASLNLGDAIIRDAVIKEIEILFPASRRMHLPTKMWLGRRGRTVLQASDLGIVGGTNLLGPPSLVVPAWKVSPLDRVVPVSLCGVGMRQPQPNRSRYTEYLLRRMLDGGIHGLRDIRAREYLDDLGVEDTYFTGCPTTWDLPYPRKEKSETCVASVNVRRVGLDAVHAVLDQLCDLYENVWFWPQLPIDLKLAGPLVRSLGINTVNPSLREFDRLLGSGADYVGMRLHGGIRAAQLGSRVLVLSVDHRSPGVLASTSIARCEFDDLEFVRSWVGGAVPSPAVELPSEVDEWRAAMRSLGASVSCNRETVGSQSLLQRFAEAARLRALKSGRR